MRRNDRYAPKRSKLEPFWGLGRRATPRRTYNLELFIVITPQTLLNWGE